MKINLTKKHKIGFFCLPVLLFGFYGIYSSFNKEARNPASDCNDIKILDAFITLNACSLQQDIQSALNRLTDVTIAEFKYASTNWLGKQPKGHVTVFGNINGEEIKMWCPLHIEFSSTDENKIEMDIQCRNASYRTNHLYFYYPDTILKAGNRDSLVRRQIID